MTPNCERGGSNHFTEGVFSVFSKLFSVFLVIPQQRAGA